MSNILVFYNQKLFFSYSFIRIGIKRKGNLQNMSTNIAENFPIRFYKIITVLSLGAVRYMWKLILFPSAITNEIYKENPRYSPYISAKETRRPPSLRISARVYVNYGDVCRLSASLIVFIIKPRSISSFIVSISRISLHFLVSGRLYVK